MSYSSKNFILSTSSILFFTIPAIAITMESGSARSRIHLHCLCNELFDLTFEKDVQEPISSIADEVHRQLRLDDGEYVELYLGGDKLVCWEDDGAPTTLEDYGIQDNARLTVCVVSFRDLLGKPAKDVLVQALLEPINKYADMRSFQCGPVGHSNANAVIRRWADNYNCDPNRGWDKRYDPQSDTFVSKTDVPEFLSAEQARLLMERLKFFDDESVCDERKKKYAAMWYGGFDPDADNFLRRDIDSRKTLDELLLIEPYSIRVTKPWHR